MEFEHINSWKAGGEDVAREQMMSATRELGCQPRYPEHWQIFLQFMSNIREKEGGKAPLKILDIGCGSGVHYALVERHFPGCTNYLGGDYNEDAVKLAAEVWTGGKFMCMDYKQLNKESVEGVDILLACSLTNVLPDADKCIDHLLSLDIKHVILSKVLITTGQSQYTTYKAYDKVVTYKFYHNLPGLIDIFKKHNYDGYIDDHKESDNRNFLLTKI